MWPKDIHRHPCVRSVTPKPQMTHWVSFDPQDIVAASEFLPDAGTVLEAEKLKKLGGVGIGLPKGHVTIG